MKMKWCIGFLVLATALADAQTNNLTALLQQGLLEEQANRNLDAAIADYQALAQRFDQDRQLAATAVFRLGECYRAQGRTNEAAAQYQRILQDFSDQPTLVTLSRQDLTGMGFSAFDKTTGGGTEATSPVPVSENSDVQLWNKLKDMPRNEMERVLPTLVPDRNLDNLVQQRNEAQAKLAQIQTDYSTSNIVYVREKTLLDEINRQMDEKITGMMQGLKLRAELAANNRTAGTADAASPAPAGSDEDREIQRIQQMIQNSPDLVDAASDGSTPLVKAAYNGWQKVAAYLLEHGANVNTPSPETGPVTPLMAAVSAGNKAMTQFLIERGANVNYQARGGLSPLRLAVEKKFQAVVEALLAGHADVNARDNDGRTPLFSAVEGGQLKILQMLLGAGADVNLKDYGGQTALNRAIGSSPEIFQALLAAGINPNTQDRDGRTPLSYAVERDSAKIRPLLAAKADPNGGSLDAPLLGALEKQDATAAELLLQAGANPNATGPVDWEFRIGDSTYSGRNWKRIAPLYFAATEGRLPLVQLLLKYKADPNDSQTDNQSMLFSVLKTPEVVRALLDGGAKAEATNAPSQASPSRPGVPGGIRGGPNVHHTLLQQAARQNLSETVALLLQHGANPDACDETGNSVLHDASFALADEMVFASLLDHKANPNVRNSDGKTPLDLLKERQHDNFNWLDRFDTYEAKNAHVEKLMALLRQHGALDKLPEWDRITVIRPGANYSEPVFYDESNHWNHFTLLDAIYKHRLFANPQLTLPFPDLAHLVISRPAADGTIAKRITVNLLDATNGIDFARDVPLEFGDVIEIPEREHSLAESQEYLTGPQWDALRDHFRKLAGEAKLIVAGGQAVQIPLEEFHASIGAMLQLGIARAALTSNSDLTRVKVTRHEPHANKTEEWTLDCSKQSPPDLWLRDGDVIEVPEKP